MDYLIKDLSRMTGIPAHAIRKWQERYHILRPYRTPNGYWHYSNEDFFVLKSIQQRLSQAQRLKTVMQLGREVLLRDQVSSFPPEHLHFLNLVRARNYDAIERLFEEQRRKSFSSWISRVIRPAVILVGKGWEQNLISVPEEHGFSHWLHAYIMRKTQAFGGVEKEACWLVVTFPGDPHDLSSLLYYACLRSHQINAWYTGMLPENELLHEVESGRFKGVSISVVMKQPEEKIRSLREAIQKRNKQIKIRFGGYALGAVS